MEAIKKRKSSVETPLRVSVILCKQVSGVYLLKGSLTTTILTHELLDQLLAGYERPEDLTGDDGLFRRLKKALIERALGAELMIILVTRGATRRGGAAATAATG